MNMVSFSKNEEKIWKNFIGNFKIPKEKEQQLRTYLCMLLQENKKINLTTITSIEGVINYHFADSLSITKYVDFTQIESICDIGSGGGFPGLPLKILFPHLALTLIEVVQKKVRFLQAVINKLGLEHVGIYDQDWRTFLRKTDDDIDLFCARASLQPEELIRIFKPSSSYKSAQLIYWAATGWEPSEKVAPFVQKAEKYKIGNKKRKFVFLSS